MLNCSVMSDSATLGSFVHGDSPSKNTGVGCHALLQGIFTTQGLNPGLLQCRGFFTVSYQGSQIKAHQSLKVFLTFPEGPPLFLLFLKH